MRLEAACEQALALGTLRHNNVRDQLANNRNQITPEAKSDWASPVHANLRGPGYYQRIALNCSNQLAQNTSMLNSATITQLRSVKSWLACALAQYACRQGSSALHLRVPRLAQELRILHEAGSFRRWLQQLAKIDLLVLDDWGIGNLDAATRADLLEVIDDRVGQPTIIAHQLPIEHRACVAG